MVVAQDRAQLLLSVQCSKFRLTSYKSQMSKAMGHARDARLAERRIDVEELRMAWDGTPEDYDDENKLKPLTYKDFVARHYYQQDPLVIHNRWMNATIVRREKLVVAEPQVKGPPPKAPPQTPNAAEAEPMRPPRRHLRFDFDDSFDVNIQKLGKIINHVRRTANTVAQHEALSALSRELAGVRSDEQEHEEQARGAVAAAAAASSLTSQDASAPPPPPPTTSSYGWPAQPSLPPPPPQRCLAASNDQLVSAILGSARSSSGCMSSTKPAMPKPVISRRRGEVCSMQFCVTTQHSHWNHFGFPSSEFVGVCFLCKVKFKSDALGFVFFVSAIVTRCPIPPLADHLVLAVHPHLPPLHTSPPPPIALRPCLHLREQCERTNRTNEDECTKRNKTSPQKEGEQRTGTKTATTC